MSTTPQQAARLQAFDRRFWPTEQQRPDETLMEWSRRLDDQENAGLADG